VEDKELYELLFTLAEKEVRVHSPVPTAAGVHLPA
jgi:hypothetical protein